MPDPLPPWDVLYAAHAPRLTAFCRLLTGRDADAHDLFQDTWARALARSGEYREAGAFGAWLSTLAYRLWVDRRRRGAAEAKALRHLPPPSPAPAPDAEDLRLLREALARLPEELLDTVLLYEVEGLPLRAVADAQGLSHTAVRERLARAHRELGKSLLPVSRRAP